LPVIVLAPVDVADCYSLTVEAFNLSERFRCPVFLASNKETGMTRESVDPAFLQLPSVIERKRCPEDRKFRPFAPGEKGHVPDFLPIGGARLVRQTSSTHDEYGYITADSGSIDRAIRRMERKLCRSVGSFSFVEYDRDDSADLLLITYGVTGRAAKEAVERIRKDGEAISLLILKTLFPVPRECIQRSIADAERIVVIEMNLGQYVREVERLAGNKPVRFYGRMDGELIAPETIREVTGL
jgi:2-oxoglutarate ferredoxin oxidoreductase subunit alpha